MIRKLVITASVRRWVAATPASTSTTTAPAAAASEDPTENLSPNIHRTAAGKIPDVHVARRIELHRIDQRVQLLRIHDVALVTGMTTRRVDTVSEQHDRFSSLHATQLLIDDHIDGVVQTRAVVSP